MFCSAVDIYPQFSCALAKTRTCEYPCARGGSHEPSYGSPQAHVRPCARLRPCMFTNTPGPSFIPRALACTRYRETTVISARNQFSSNKNDVNMYKYAKKKKHPSLSHHQHLIFSGLNEKKSNSNIFGIAKIFVFGIHFVAFLLAITHYHSRPILLSLALYRSTPALSRSFSLITRLVALFLASNSLSFAHSRSQTSLKKAPTGSNCSFHINK